MLTKSTHPQATWIVFVSTLVMSLMMVSSYAATSATAAPKVESLLLKFENIRLWHTFSGRLSAVDSAEIRPRVVGEIQDVLFKDGQLVKKGDTLFIIDPRSYEASVASAKAKLASATSREKLAHDELNRIHKLVKSKLVSESAYDAAKNDYAVASAAIREAESALIEAELNLSYCFVKAPFDGRISRAELTVGNMVEKTPNAPLLATLIANDTLYAEFNIDEQTYIKSVRNRDNIDTMPVELILATDETKIYTGRMHAFDNQLDTATGTIRARAILDNVDGVLLPGMYANIRLGSASPKEVLLIPERAIATNQDKKFVYVINEDNKAIYREVELGEHFRSRRVVLTGLNQGERIITGGLAHIRPNTAVDIKSNNAQ